MKQNIIICKLDEVISQLEKIEETQYMLYHAIMDSNKNAEKNFKRSIKWIEYFKK